MTIADCSGGSCWAPDGIEADFPRHGGSDRLVGTGVAAASTLTKDEAHRIAGGSS